MAISKKEYLELLQQSALDGTFPGINKTGMCCYVTKTGSRCAIGILIPRDRILPRYKWLELGELLRGPWAEYIPAGAEVGDLEEIRRIHNMYAVEAYLRDRLARWDAKGFIQRIRRCACFTEVLNQVPEPAIDE